MPPIATLTMNPALDVTTRTAEVRPTHKLRCAAPRFDPGGGGINVARVVHALGGDAVAVFPSGGHTGAALEALLDEQGVTSVARRIEGTTRESLAVDEEKSGRQFRFVMPGPRLSRAEQKDLLEALATLPRAPALIVASGSLPPGCPADFYLRLARRCREAGIPLVVDTSGPALAALEGARVRLIKPSLSELESLAGSEIGSEAAESAAAHVLVERGFAEAVVVSLGERGALLVTADEERRFDAIRVPAKSAVGAGDSMVAGIALRLADGGNPVEAVRHGIAAGAAALLTPGTGLARRKDFERLYAAMAKD